VAVEWRHGSGRSSSTNSHDREPSAAEDGHTSRSVTMGIFLALLLIGVIAGLRAMTAPAAVSWAARLGWLELGQSNLAFLGYALTPWILTALAIAELVSDQRPSTPSRTVPLQFGTRILMGALSGAAIGSGTGTDALGLGIVAAIIGVIVGTLGGRAFRARLAAAFGSDRPAAFIEDAVAIGGAILVLGTLL
jgi:uncharacterized membrane protein